MTEVKVNRSVSFEYPGEIIVRQGESTNWQNIIQQADPIAKFSPEVLKQALDQPGWPACILRMTPPPEGTEPHFCYIGECFGDWKVECIGANASYTYIIKTYDWQRHCWIGAWPD